MRLDDGGDYQICLYKNPAEVAETIIWYKEWWIWTIVAFVIITIVLIIAIKKFKKSRHQTPAVYQNKRDYETSGYVENTKSPYNINYEEFIKSAEPICTKNLKLEPFIINSMNPAYINTNNNSLRPEPIVIKSLSGPLIDSNIYSLIAEPVNNLPVIREDVEERNEVPVINEIKTVSGSIVYDGFEDSMDGS